MLIGNIPDQFHDQNGFSDAGAAEQADLTAACIGRQQVDNLDACFQHFSCRENLGEAGRFPVDGKPLGPLDRAFAVNGFADDVEHSAQGLFTDRNGNGSAGIRRLQAA